MKLGILGSGTMGEALGDWWAAKGHEVSFGSRDPARARLLAKRAGSHCKGGTLRDAARNGDVLLLAVPGAAAIPVVKDAGDLHGKVLIDCTNPLRDDLAGLTLGTTTSMAEEIARASKGVRVVKALNTTFAYVLQSRDATFDGTPASAFYCGDEAIAKQEVAKLLYELGFEPLDCGPLSSARYLEPLGMLMIELAYKMERGTAIGLKLLERAEPPLRTRAAGPVRSPVQSLDIPLGKA
jgi:hypothetical protein